MIKSATIKSNKLHSSKVTLSTLEELKQHVVSLYNRNKAPDNNKHNNGGTKEINSKKIK